MCENNNSGMHNVMAFLLGGAIGAAIALLYAPGSGDQTRRRIKEGIDSAKGRAKDSYEAALETIEEQVEAVKGIANDKKEEIKAAFDAGKDAFNKEKARHQGV